MGSFIPAKSTAILLAALLVLAVGVAFSYDRTNALRESNDQLLHSYRVIGKVHELDAAMREAESRQRAYLIAGQERYYESYQLVATRVPAIIAELRELNLEDPGQLASVSELKGKALARIELLDQNNRLRRTGGVASLLQIEFESGRQLMDELDAIEARIIRVEDHLLALRSDGNRASAGVLYATLLATGVSASVMAVLVLLVFRREARTWEQFRVTLASIGDGVIVTDDQGRITYMNDIAEDLTEWTLREASGRVLTDVFSIIDEITRAPVVNPIADVIRSGEVIAPPTHTILTSRSGSDRYIDHSAAPIRAEGGDLSGAVLVFRDIAERRQAEKQLEDLNATLEARVAERSAEARRRATQLQALSLELTHAEQRERRRLAHVLHDGLQQLLVAAKMRLAILAGRLKNPAMDADIHEATELLDQSIAASRSLSVELSPPVLFNSGLVAGLEWLARWMKEKHQLTVTVKAATNVDPLNEDSRAFLFQAVRELLFNVVKHSGVSEAEVSLAVEEPDRLRICVVDHGNGFVQATDVTRADGEQAGFGLLGIGERLAMMAGGLEVKSAPGEGTRATLTVQIRRPTADEKAGAQR